MRTIEIKLALFEELSDERKLIEIENTRNSEYYLSWEWWDYIDEDFKTILEIIGFYNINTSFSGFWSQGDGASFTASYSNEKNITKKIKQYAPLDTELQKIVRNIVEIQQSCKYQYEATIYQSGNYSHEMTMKLEDLYEDKFEEYDEWFLENCRYLAVWYYGRLQNEYEYLMSDEVIAEHLIANEVEFEI